MKFKKICFSTDLTSLYGRENYQSHIKKGREYWCYFSREEGINAGWYKIKVTYVRSGCMFYRITNHPEIEERFCATSCYMASTLVVSDIDPSKDLKDFDDETTKKLYRFNTEHTVVHNWPNEKEIEINENDPAYMIARLMLEKANVPKLPATTLESDCYSNMFANCTRDND